MEDKNTGTQGDIANISTPSKSEFGIHPFSDYLGDLSLVSASFFLN
jgi:hypothetical protein